jgi:hypothetical protein
MGADCKSVAQASKVRILHSPPKGQNSQFSQGFLAFGVFQSLPRFLDGFPS